MSAADCPIVCLDMEGVLTPEIWIAVAEKTGIAELRRTTRDEPDYDKLMRGRLALLERHKLRLSDIQAVTGSLEPLPGAFEFLNALRVRFPVLLLSDTFYPFAGSLIAKLAQPVLFCHTLEVAKDGSITNYRLRLADQKRKTVRALKDLNFRVSAVGDSYNDVGMLSEAHNGILFCPPEHLPKEMPQFPVARSYRELTALLDRIMAQ